MKTGSYSVSWDGKDDPCGDVSSGTYFCRLVRNGRALEAIEALLLK